MQLERGRAQGDEAERRRAHDEQRDAGHGDVGAAAVAAEVTPNPRAAKSRYGRLGWWMRPTAREPRIAPTLSMVVSSPYVPPVPWKVSLANTGKTTAKLKAKSPTTDIMSKREPELLAPGRVAQALP